MSDEVDALKIRVMDIPFKANGAGLTLSAVAASNIFAEERARVDELQGKLNTKPQLSRLILGVNITMNAALAAFCAGVITAFLVLTGVI